MRLLLIILALALALPAPAQLANVPDWHGQESEASSTPLRAKGASYLRRIEFAQPEAATTAAQLTALNPHLPKILPDFEKIMASAEVSDRFAELYERKLLNIKKGELLTPHNYFDCETVLRLKHPESGRHVLLLQADMDVVTDGSDPGRVAELANYNLARSSDWFLPETAFSWPKSGGPANPFLDYYPATLSKLQEFRTQLEGEAKADPGVVWRELIRTTDDQIYRIKERGLHDYTKRNLRNRRFLLADRDPFVVLPVPWVNKSAAWSPKMGDYAAVIHQDKIYPAILGDAGPTFKVGEASLFLARQLNPKADGKTRAISDLTVTYLFFPKSSTGMREPDLAAWHKKVTTLLNDIGGLGENATLHEWELP